MPKPLLLVVLGAVLAAACHPPSDETRESVEIVDVGGGGGLPPSDGGTDVDPPEEVPPPPSDGGTDLAPPPPPPPPPPPADGGTVEAPPPVTYLHEYYVANTGSDSNSGGPTSPFRTISRALQAAVAGDRITVRAGTYRERVQITGSIAAGTPTHPIRLQGEGLPKIAPSSSTGSLVVIEKPWWQVDSFEVDVEGMARYAAHFAGTVTGSVLSNSKLHHGSSGAGVSTHYDANGASILNNEIHNFVKPGDDSHGVIVQYSSKNITIRGNTIHHNSGDSVQCLGPEGYSSAAPAENVVIENNTMYSDGEQAVDIKTCNNVRIARNVMRDYLTALPGGCSMVIHMSASNVTVEDNEIFNVGKAIAIGGNHEGPVPFNVVVRRNRIRNVVKGTDLEGVGVKLENSESARVYNNTILWVDHAGVQAGGGTGGDTSNLHVKNNIIQPRNGGSGIRLGSYAPGFVADRNLYPPGTPFYAGGTKTFAAWQISGRDASGREGDPELNPDTLVPGAAARDWGADLGLTFCGTGPDVGAVETGC